MKEWPSNWEFMDPETRAIVEAGRAAEEAFKERLRTPGTPENTAWQKAALDDMAELARDILKPGSPEHEWWFVEAGNSMADFEQVFGRFTTEEERAQAHPQRSA